MVIVASESKIAKFVPAEIAALLIYKLPAKCTKL